MMGGTFDFAEVQIGRTREEPSRARIRVSASTEPALDEILHAIQDHGALAEDASDCQLEPAPAYGVLPEEFYATTHLPTLVRVNGRWIKVASIEMDVAIRIDPVQAIPMNRVCRGDLVVTGRDGVRFMPVELPRERDIFGFMEAQLSSEQPHLPVLTDLARRTKALRDDDGSREKMLLADGPAIIHAGGREALTWLIEAEFIHGRVLRKRPRRSRSRSRPVRDQPGLPARGRTDRQVRA